VYNPDRSLRKRAFGYAISTGTGDQVGDRLGRSGSWRRLGYVATTKER